MTSSTRRYAILGGAAAIVAGFQAAPNVLDRLSSDFEFTPLASPTGFRRIASGDMSRTIDLFAGLDGGVDPAIEALAQTLRPDPRLTLFQTPVQPGQAQIASFSDFYCPYCRILTERLLDIEDGGSAAITWHQTPIFGPSSEMAARGAIAAIRQGGYRAYHTRLMRSAVRANPVYLRQVATDLGFDAEAFAYDMASRATSARLETSAAMSHLFGLIGTPALVVGTTVVQGAISAPNLRQLIEIEAALA